MSCVEWHGLEPYREDYVSGFTYMLGQTDLSKGVEGLAKSRKDFNRESNSWAAEDIGGDKAYANIYATHFGTVTFKYILLPVWLASCKYEGQLYYFFINGYTGKVTGEYPKSVAKVLGAVLAACVGTSLLCTALWVLPKVLSLFQELIGAGEYAGALLLVLIIVLIPPSIYYLLPERSGIVSDPAVDKPKLKFVKFEKSTSFEPGNKSDSKLPFSLKIILAIILIIPFVLLFGPAGCIIGPVILFLSLLFAADR